MAAGGTVHLLFSLLLSWTLKPTNGQFGVTSAPAAQSGGGRGDTATIAVNGDSVVQLFHEGSWTKICANQWDSRDAQVVCRMLGYWHGQGTADLRQKTFSDLVLVDNVVCAGNETSLTQCRFDGYRSQQCDIGRVAAVNCDPTDKVSVRLTDGFGPWEGRLEVRRQGVWRPVCQTGFDDDDAQVVCRLLGIRTQGGKARTGEKFPQSVQPPLIKELDCEGQESDISQCKGRDAAVGEQCHNAGVECYSCGGLYGTETGTLQSEGFPASYPRNLNCLYVIRPNNDQQLYKLEFSNFSTEACCDKLQVKVLTGSTNLPGGNFYSGDTAPPRLLGKAFALSFITDGSRAVQGFQAMWSPARVEDVVSVTCEEGHFTVDIDLNFLKRLYPQSSEETIALADPTCIGTVISDNSGDRLIIKSETDSCGTKIVTTDSAIEYHNFLVDRVFATGNTMIVRDRRWEMPIHCAVVRTDNFEVQYNPFPDIGKRDAIRRSEAGDVVHIRERREVRGSISVDLNFPIFITAYTDRTFASAEAAPLARRLGDEVDLRVEMSGGDLDLKLVLQNCYTKPELTSNVTYNIIENGCAIDANTQILDIHQHITDFRFTAFEFSGDFPHVYLICDVRVCSANDNGADCTQQCASGKRSVSEPIINREIKSRLYRMHFGPIVVVN